MIPHDGQRLFGFWIAQKPLFADARFDRHIAAIAEPSIVFIRLGFREGFPGLQQLGGFFARFESVQSIQLRFCRTIDPAVGVQNIDDGELVPLTDLEIDGIVSRGNFQNSSAEFWINRLIGDDGDLLASERAPSVFA